MVDKLFLIHGMGHHSTEWHKSVEKKLNDLYKRYSRLSRLSFEDRFQIVPLNYDDVFRRLVSDWQDNSEALGPISDQMGASFVADQIGWLREAGEVDENFLWTHASDVLLYRLFASVRQEVKTKIASAIAKEIIELGAADRWSVIAHSLGTAVIHDSLDMLWTGQMGSEHGTGFEPRHEQALLIAMLANVSRVLQTNPNAYESTVKPGAAGEEDRGCLVYLTARHVLDPFCIPKMFRPLNWPDVDSEERGLYQYVEVDHFHQADIHGFLHYLDHPSVHIPLFRNLTFRTAITQDEEDKALSAFKRFGGLTEKAGIAIKERIEDRSPAIGSNWTGFRSIWKEFYDFGD